MSRLFTIPWHTFSGDGCGGVCCDGACCDVCDDHPPGPVAEPVAESVASAEPVAEPVAAFAEGTG